MTELLIKNDMTGPAGVDTTDPADDMTGPADMG